MTQVRLQLERSYQKQLQRFLAKWYASFGRVLRPYLSNLRQESLRIKKLPRAQRKDATNIVLSELDSFVTEIKKSQEFYDYQEYTYVWLVRFYELGAIDASASIGYPATSTRVNRALQRVYVAKEEKRRFELKDGLILFMLQDRAYFSSVLAAETMIRDAKKLIRDKFFKSDSAVEELATEMTTTFDNMSIKRARTIVRTESQVAIGNATHDMYKRSGIEYHTWLSVGDKQVRPAHKDNDGTTVRVGDPFQSGQIHTGDGPLATNCRCSTMPVIIDGLSFWGGGALLPVI